MVETKRDKSSILVVEDDKQIRNFIVYSIETEGFSALAAGTAHEALSLLTTEACDLIVLDLGLPDFDGMEVIRRVREQSDIPIIVVSARDQDQEKVQALDSGADDYLSKPFTATELLARIRVAFRHLRQQQSEAKPEQLEVVGRLVMDPSKRLVYLAGESIHLTPMEYNLLAYFFQNIGKVLTSKQIIKAVWGTHYVNDTQALRTLMAGLRRKIEQNPAKPEYIVTEVGVGYRLLDE